MMGIRSVTPESRSAQAFTSCSKDSLTKEGGRIHKSSRFRGSGRIITYGNRSTNLFMTDVRLQDTFTRLMHPFGKGLYEKRSSVLHHSRFHGRH